MTTVILAPHLDDEVIGCFTVVEMVDLILYFHKDYRASLPHVLGDGRYREFDRNVLDQLSSQDLVYLPSQFDLHPLHKAVRREGLRCYADKRFYSVEMNVPWLEEEDEPEVKRDTLRCLYPGEELQEKWWRFRSIQTFDEVLFASVRFRQVGMHKWEHAPAEVSFLRSLHRHVFHLQVDVQQYHDSRDLEYFLLLGKVKQMAEALAWKPTEGCEQFGTRLKRALEAEFAQPPRIVRVSIYEDGENGCVIE